MEFAALHSPFEEAEVRADQAGREGVVAAANVDLSSEPSGRVRRRVREGRSKGGGGGRKEE